VIQQVKPGEGTSVTRRDQLQEHQLLFVFRIDYFANLIGHICHASDVLIIKAVDFPAARTLVPLKQ
jgi:hypothetical protein